MIGGILIMLLLGTIELARYQATVQALRIATGDAARAALVTVNAGFMNNAACPATVAVPSAPIMARTPMLTTTSLTLTANVDCTARRVTVALSYPFNFIVRFLPQATITVTDGTSLNF